MKIAINSTKEGNKYPHESPDKLWQESRGERVCFLWSWESYTDGLALEKDLKNEQAEVEHSCPFRLGSLPSPTAFSNSAEGSSALKAYVIRLGPSRQFKVISLL